ncbi:MAG: shikimate dehydrogenase [Rickettsiaceae bacterium H1]|nr:shikimate dehydrogenase [Rickettsiaceae bacterium H1]
MNKIGLIGADVSNSLSPVIHNFFLKQSNISVRYHTFSVNESELKNITSKLIKEAYIGFNVTIPYKEIIIPLLDSVDEIAAKIGAVNTVLIKNGKLCGFNTDYYGFIKGIKSQISDFQFKGITVLVLGAGGAARAVLYALNIENVDKIYLCNHAFAKANLLAQKFEKVIPIPWKKKEEILNKCSLVVNATPIPIDLSDIKNGVIVNDLIYFLTSEIKPVLNGLSMLIWQAKLAFNIWFDDA